MQEAHSSPTFWLIMETRCEQTTLDLFSGSLSFSAPHMCVSSILANVKYVKLAYTTKKVRELTLMHLLFKVRGHILSKNAQKNRQNDKRERVSRLLHPCFCKLLAMLIYQFLTFPPKTKCFLVYPNLPDRRAPWLWVDPRITSSRSRLILILI